MTPELHALAGVYALDALNDEERRVFEEHLSDCSDCAEEVTSLRIAAAELSQLGPVAPPPQLRADVLSAISQVRPLAPVTDNVIALRRARMSRSVWQVMAAACALIAMVAAGWGYQQHRDANAVSQTAASVASVLDAGDAAAVSGAVGSGRATLVYSKSEGKLVLVGHDIALPPAGKVYQLWMISGAGAKFTSAGTFSPRSSGEVSVIASGDLAASSGMGISVEPAGGSKQPTQVVASMDI